MKSIPVPSFTAWKNVMPGVNRKPTLHINGIVNAPTPCDQPYLSPLKGGAPLLFEVKFKNTAKPGTFCPQIILPKSILPYKQAIVGTEKVLLIKVPGLKTPISVPIKTVS